MTAAVGVQRGEFEGDQWRVRRWLPARERASIEEFGVEGRPFRYLLGVALTLAVVAIPCVTKATNVDLRVVGVVFCLHAGWVIAAHRLFYPHADRSLPAFYALSLGMVAQGALIALSLPVLSHDPSTPLWVAFVIMACAVGASETEASLVLGFFFPLAPLATVPAFLVRGQTLSHALAGPLVASFASGYGYWYISRRRG